MSETEDPFILVEPSCDIHLVLGAELPNDRRHVPLRVFRGVWNESKRHHDLSIIGDHLAFDWLGLDGATPSSVVTMSAVDANGAHALVPHAKGVVLLQVRFLDPARAGKYEYLVVRIEVHERLEGWRFGHETIEKAGKEVPALSVFKDAELAHTQPTILALFDKNDDTPSGVAADISAHGYVKLQSASPSIVAVDTKYVDRLRGVTLGETDVSGDLALPYDDFEAPPPLSVKVIDPHRPPDNRLQPVSNFTHRNVDPRTKLNLLFLAEGFTSDAHDRALFLRAVNEMTKGLLSKPRNEPYRMLRDHFNVWYYFEPSLHRGLTAGPPLTKKWWYAKKHVEIPVSTYIPQLGSPDDPTNPDAIDLWDLLVLVGLPKPTENRSVAQLRAAWKAADSLPRFLGYNDALVTDDVVEYWRRLIPLGIAQGYDTVYGLYQGSRWGDRESGTEDRSKMISQPPAGASEDVRRKFAKRMYQWFNPRNVVRSLRFDPRRYAPEFHSAGLLHLIRYISRLENPTADQATHRQVGKLWDSKTDIDEHADPRHYNSAGLVCLLINSPHYGGTAAKGLMFRVSVGEEPWWDSGFFGEFGPPRRRELRLGSRAHELNPNLGELTDTLAHELGHSYYGLGDEYEARRGSADPEVERYDNITHLDTIRVADAPDNPAFPPPVDPDKVKWATLHRIAKADTLLRPSTIGDSAGPGRSSKIVVTLGAGRATEWTKERTAGTLVYLRKLNIKDHKKQLPIDEFDDLYEELTIAEIPDGRTLVLFGEEALDPKPFPTGSVLYVPTTEDGNPLELVHEKVLDYMDTTRWNSSDASFPPGVALSENHRAGDSKLSDWRSDKADVPPSIPGFTKPCAEHRVIGLYEGGATWTRKAYRPTGACKMRSGDAKKTEGEYCFVCKYLQINQVDPSLHGKLDKQYPTGRRKKKKRKKKK